MEIKRFETLKYAKYYKPGDKIYQGTLHIDFEILKEDLEKYIDEYGDVGNAIEVYLQDHLSNKNFEYRLVDYQGNPIEDEELYDETNKYNL